MGKNHIQKAVSATLLGALLLGAGVALAQEAPAESNREYDRGYDREHGYHERAQVQRFAGRAYRISRNSFVLHSSRGPRYIVYLSRNYIIVDSSGRPIRVRAMRSGDYVRVGGYERGGNIYATHVRDLSI